jgi:hypothetical protein
MQTDLLLFPECVLPGCKNLIEVPGHPCADCLDAFSGGSLIQIRLGQPLTEHQIAERDEGIKAAYAAQRELRIAQGLEAKRNQTCWLCQERRACTKQERGWECAACRSIT